MSEQRWALCHAVRLLGRPVAAVAREYGVSRKTAYKWLKVYDRRERETPAPEALQDRSRRPLHSPRQIGAAVEAQVLAVRDRRGWGPRKVHAILRRESFTPLPCLRTVAHVLKRNGRVPEPQPATPVPQRFERATPNALWQLDHKGPVEVDRQKLLPLAIIDDHSRYALAFEPMTDRTMARTFGLLWDLFGEVGLPQQLLCDNAFGTMGTRRPIGLSWWDAQLIRLGIDSIHGRPYHPQTQGKVERLNGTFTGELIYRHARRDSVEHFRRDCHAYRQVYNTERPHEALGDDVPLSRWRPSPRPRPATMPTAMTYDDPLPAGSTLRRVCHEGLVRWRGARVLVGRGIAGDHVRIEEQATELLVYYGFRQVRRLQHQQLMKDRVV